MGCDSRTTGNKDENLFRGLMNGRIITMEENSKNTNGTSDNNELKLYK